MFDRTVLAAFLRTSAIALGIDAAIAGRMVDVPRMLRKFGPYFALAVLVPGGSLLAIFLWFFRRKFESA